MAVRQEVQNQHQAEEFRRWQEDPVTEHLFKYLRGKKEDLKELWATGALTYPTMEETVIQNAAAQGAVSVLDQILTLEPSFLSEVE
jgi:hypothetical protein